MLSAWLQLPEWHLRKTVNSINEHNIHLNRDNIDSDRHSRTNKQCHFHHRCQRHHSSIRLRFDTSLHTTRNPDRHRCRPHIRRPRNTCLFLPTPPPPTHAKTATPQKHFDLRRQNPSRGLRTSFHTSEIRGEPLRISAPSRLSFQLASAIARSQVKNRCNPFTTTGTAGREI